MVSLDPVSPYPKNFQGRRASTYFGLVELGGGGGAALRSEDEAADTEDDELDEDDEEDEAAEEPELDSSFRGRRIS